MHYFSTKQQKPHRQLALREGNEASVQEAKPVKLLE
jgi:hypothetical protein